MLLRLCLVMDIVYGCYIIKSLTIVYVLLKITQRHKVVNDYGELTSIASLLSIEVLLDPVGPNTIMG